MLAISTCQTKPQGMQLAHGRLGNRGWVKKGVVALAGVHSMAQATKGQTKAGTAGKKTERVLVHQKGGRPEDHLDRPWMDGIPSKAPGRTAASPEQTLDHLEWSNSKAGQVPHAGGDRRGAQGFPLKRSRRQAEEVPHHQRLWEGGFCCGIANCHHQRCDPTGLVITTVFALGVIRLVW